MRVRSQAVWVGSAALILALVAGACGQVAVLQARKAWKDANALYRQQQYQQAATRYEEVIQAAPEGLPDDLTYAYFFLANSYDNLYRPGRKGEAANDELLKKAIANYQLAAEKIKDPQYKTRSLQYLMAAYRDKLNDPSQAEPVLIKLIEMDPKEPSSYYELGRLYEDSGAYDQAEAMYLKAREVRPSDPNVYVQLSGYYNRQGEYQKMFQALEERANREPNNPEAHYFVATYSWDMAYRNFQLKEAEKRAYVAKGLGAVDVALKLKPDYVDAITYKGLLLRVEANLEKNPDRQKELLKQAEQLQSRAVELKKKQVAGVG